MDISPQNTTRKKLFWTTLCTIIATFVSGVLLFHFTHNKNNTAEKLTMNLYRSVGDVFEVNYPSLLGGVQDASYSDFGCSCVISNTLPDKSWINYSWKNVAKLMFSSKFNVLVLAVVAPTNAEYESNWAENRNNVLYKKEANVRRNILYQLIENEKSSEYYEIHFEYGTWLIKDEHYIILKDEVRDGLHLRCHAMIGKDLWPKVRNELRTSIQGIKWSPEAARKVFLAAKYLDQQEAQNIEVNRRR